MEIKENDRWKIETTPYENQKDVVRLSVTNKMNGEQAVINKVKTNSVNEILENLVDEWNDGKPYSNEFNNVTTCQGDIISN